MRILFISNTLRPQPFTIILFSFLLVLCSCEPAPKQAEAVSTKRETTAEPKQAGETEVAANGAFLKASAAYFERHQRPSGRLEYIINPEGTSSDNGVYNVVRHAGALYSLAAYIEYTGDRQFEELWLKASDYMWDTNVLPIPDTKTLAIWSVPGENFYEDSFAKAKIGATGLALVAWMIGERAGLAQYPRKEVQKLGDFLLYMQAEDGQFYNTYHEKAGQVDFGRYQYYPAESALGLSYLYELDPQEKWLEGAIKTVSVPARNQAEMASKPIDHWDLIAIAKIFDILVAEGKDTTSYAYLLDYSRWMVDRLLLEYEASEVKGSFTNNYGTTPTATRVEGLTAILPYLEPDSERTLATKKAIREAVEFLWASQIREGKLAGGVPLSTVKKDAATSKESKFAIDQFNKRAAEVRIDYLQHAMSAVLGYDILCRKGIMTDS
ncbi:MAG: hypothetical protein KTR30_31450 [Saprospiraceae bacterium]|nr:hypothetical protein [Saprospiraceae bacterium]